MDFIFFRFQVVEVLFYAVEDRFLFGFIEVAERDVEAYIPEAFEPLLATWLAPRFNRAFIDGQSVIGDYQIERIIYRIAKTLAARTGSGGAVEAEKNGFWLGEFEVVVLAVEALTE